MTPKKRKAADVIPGDTLAAATIAGLARPERLVIEAARLGKKVRLKVRWPDVGDRDEFHEAHRLVQLAAEAPRTDATNLPEE